jgi:hypothetical protein
MTLTNDQEQDIVFKIMVSLPYMYGVQPPYGRIRPGETATIDITRQMMTKEPPLAYEYKDKFLVMSRVVKFDKQGLSARDLWSLNESVQVHLRKIRVVFLPAIGQSWEDEEDDSQQSDEAVTPTMTTAQLIPPDIFSSIRNYAKMTGYPVRV